MKLKVGHRDALIIVDMQKDFMPQGALPVPEGDTIIPIINNYLRIFQESKASVILTRDWHPPNHISFKSRGGLWPPHCIRNSEGAKFHPDLKIPSNAVIISKATEPDKEAYSGFDGTELNSILTSRAVKRVFICGVATEYCVKETALDALRLGYLVLILNDAIKGISKSNSEKALELLLNKGALIIEMSDLLE
ncbi:MAG: nicotinamidase [Thermoprotei archaeon]|nr:MAG: nicotinamidase [Thermoprotei archaeon]